MIPIAKPVIGEEEKQAVLKVLDSGMIAQGKKVKEFEDEFAKYIGVKHAVATSSGTTALHTALLSLGIKKGDEVITTSFTFIATANSILFTGAKPVFVDIEEDTFNIDPSLIQKKITPKTKAILPVHLYGNPCNMNAIMEIADDNNLAVVEDACQAHGASVNNKKTGSFATGCFSFYPTKNITSGEGGMITTNDSKIDETARMIREHGSKERYYHKIIGYNYRMTDIQAAIGAEQLKKLDMFNKKRIENALYLNKSLKNVKTPVIKEGCKHVFHQYTIRVKNRDKLIKILKEHGIGTSIYYPLPVHKQEPYRELGYNDKLPVTEKICEEALSLPIHPSVTKEELDKIIKIINEIK